MASVGELKAVAQQLAAKTAEAVDKERVALQALEEQERKVDEAASSLKGEEDDDERWALQEKRQALLQMKEAVAAKLETLERQQALAAAAMLAPLEEAEQSNLVDIREEYDEALHGPLRQRAGFGAGSTSGTGPQSYGQARKTTASEDKTLMARLDELEVAEAAAAATGEAKTLAGTTPNQAATGQVIMPAAPTHGKPVHDKGLGTTASGVPLPGVHDADVAPNPTNHTSGSASTSAAPTPFNPTSGSAFTSAEGSGGLAPSRGAGHSQAANLGNDGMAGVATRQKGSGTGQGHKPKPTSSGLRAGFLNAAVRGKTSRKAAAANPPKETLEIKSCTATSTGVGSRESRTSGGHFPDSGTHRPTPRDEESLEAPETAVGNVQERAATPSAGSGRVGPQRRGDGQGLGGGGGFGCFSGDPGWQDFAAEIGLSGSEEDGEGGPGETRYSGIGRHQQHPDHVPGVLVQQGQGRIVEGEGPSVPADGVGFLGDRGQGRKVVGEGPSVPADGRPMTKGRKVSLFMQQRAQMKKTSGV